MVSESRKTPNGNNKLSGEEQHYQQMQRMVRKIAEKRVVWTMPKFARDSVGYSIILFYLNVGTYLCINTQTQTYVIAIYILSTRAYIWSHLF